jgi:hypothetical protein
MSNVMIPSNFGAVSTRFANQKVEDDLSAGVSAGFGIISYRGKVWRTKFRGEETSLMREDGDGPRASIEVIILKAANHLSKIFYKDGYKEGSTESPDCFSTNGLTPDINSKAKQANTCANCPMNAWGSRITPAGKPGKACSDSKRAVVVPLGDMDNEVFGGPMLLRIPAASLQDLAQYGQKMGALGYPYYAIGTRISFDVKEAFPKFVFNAIRPLTDEEADRVIELRDDPRVGRILSEAEVSVEAAPAEPAFEQQPTGTARSTGNGGASFAPSPTTSSEPVKRAPAPAALPAHDPETGEVKAEAPKRSYKKTPAPAPVAAPVEEEDAPTSTSFDDELDAQLDGLLPK